MGVYIKGMDMPKGCKSCPFVKDEDEQLGFYRCFASGKRFGQLTSSLFYWYDDSIKFLDCPLTEVPEPHGRLIDADACIDYIRSNNQHAWEVLAYAPTVIERSNNE